MMMTTMMLIMVTAALMGGRGGEGRMDGGNDSGHPWRGAFVAQASPSAPIGNPIPRGIIALRLQIQSSVDPISLWVQEINLLLYIYSRSRVGSTRLPREKN